MTSAWSHTKQALTTLESLLCCEICKQLVDKPCTLGGCEHFFCRGCVDDIIGKECIVCGVPSHVKDVQTNRLLANAVSMCKRLNQLVDRDLARSPDGEDESSDVSPEAELSNLCKADSSKDEIKVNAGKGSYECTWSESVISWEDFLPDAPEIPISARTRKSKAAAVRKQTVANSNEKWGIGVSSETSFNHPCDGFKKPVEAKSRKRVLFQSLPMQLDSVQSTKLAEVKPGNGNESEPKPLSDVFEDDNGGSQKENEANMEHMMPSVGPSPTDRGVAVNATPAGPSDEKNSISDLSASNKRGERNTGQLKKSKQPEERQNKQGRTSKQGDKAGNCGNNASSRGNETRNRSNRDGRKNTRVAKRKSASVSCKRSPLVHCGHANTSNLSIDGSPVVVQTHRGLWSPVGSPSQSPVVKKNAKGETPLHLAAIKGDIDKVRSLLSEGATPNVKDNAGWTPLHEACNHGHTVVAELLLDHDAFINAPGMENDTPLHDAVSNYRLDCVRLLVSRGASLNARNIQGYTPFDLAQTGAMKDALHTPVAITQTNRTLTKHPQSFDINQVVMLTTGLNREERNKLNKLSSILHGKLVSDYTNEVTHVVTAVNDHGLCPRTLKYLQALLAGKWIISYDWAEICLEYKERVSEEPFEVPGASSSPNSQAPKKARENREKQLPGLFDGCQFYFQGEFSYPTPEKDELAALVKMGGGSVLVREPRVDNVDQSDFTVPYHAESCGPLANCSYFIVNDNRETVATLFGDGQFCEVPATWLLDSIAYFTLLDIPGTK